MISITDISATQAAVASNTTEQQLTCIWQEILGIESIGLDQNYFDLGGDSSLAVLLFTQIEKVFKVKLPLATLYEAPTIAELSRILVQEAPSSSGWSPLVAIQPAGSRPPFFCMHGAGGNVLIYRDLSLDLGQDQPFYGLQSQGLDGSSPPLTKIEEMAALYLKEIRKVQPHGPYFLGGYCMGGTIAFEVAQQLQAAGEQIGLLALFDTMNWSKILPITSWDRNYFAIERLIFHAANFFHLDGKGRVEFWSEKMDALRNRIPVWRGMLLAKFGKRSHTAKSISRVLGEIWKTNDRACLDYIAKPYPGKITDFRPMKQYRIYNRVDIKWNHLAQGGQEIIVLPVYPAGLLNEPFVKHLAVVLRESMDGAMRSCGTS